MNEVLLIGMPGGTEWIIILVVVLLLFGGSRLPQLAKALGQSKRAFRDGQAEAEEEEERLEKARLSGATEKQSSLAATNDEELFEEARRRARLRATETANDKADNMQSDSGCR